MQDNGIPAGDQQAKVVVEVLETEARWVQAHHDLDVAAIEDILDDAYRRIEQDGAVIGKSEVVASYRSGERHWDVAEGSDYAVQVFDDVAVVAGIWRGVGVNQGQAFDYRARFLAVYIKRPDGWKLFRDESFTMDD